MVELRVDNNNTINHIVEAEEQIVLSVPEASFNFSWDDGNDLEYGFNTDRTMAIVGFGQVGYATISR